MKKTITSLMLGLFALTINSQTVVNDFESFTLTPNSFYKDTNSVPFQTTSAIFEYQWTNGQYPYWSGGFSYTNVNDSTNGSYTNLYGCRAFKGYNNSAKYATAQDNAVLKMKAPYDRLDGFYVTNTTYAYKSMKNGDQFAKKFGGPTGNDPDWFKVTAKGFFNGTMKADSAVFYLADFRFTNNSSDYIVENWQWLDASVLGQVDSVKFFMYSSDTTAGYINTPLFFSVDNVTISDAYVGISENQFNSELSVFPNPFSAKLNLKTSVAEPLTISLFNIDGKQIATYELKSENPSIDLAWLEAGIYFMEVKTVAYTTTRKLIKN